MAWDFETEPEFQEKLDWADQFVREEVEPLDLIWRGLEFTPLDDNRRKAIDPLKEEVRRQELWATHLGPELGGQGYGQLKLSLLNEILGRSSWAPIVFGCQAPDTGNAEIIAHYGTEEQKERYLKPLLEGEVFSCYSMTEPHAGADPTMFTTRAEKDGDEWVINGWKFFSSNAKTSSFLIVMVVTNPDVSAYNGMSMFLVPTDTPGVNIVRNVGLGGESQDEGSHALIHYEDVRVPEDALLGAEGGGWTQLMAGLNYERTILAATALGLAQRAFDDALAYAKERRQFGRPVGSFQALSHTFAELATGLAQARLLVRHVAALTDEDPSRMLPREASMAKLAATELAKRCALEGVQIMGGYGYATEYPMERHLRTAVVTTIYGGTSEIQKNIIAKTLGL